jgi:hypothetical protein
MMHKKLLTLPLKGRAITLCGIVYGKGSKRKKEECILFSLKTFSHKTVSNHSVVMLPRGLSVLLKALSDVERERLLSRVEGVPRYAGPTLRSDGREIETQNSLACIA